MVCVVCVCVCVCGCVGVCVGVWCVSGVECVCVVCGERVRERVRGGE